MKILFQFLLIPFVFTASCKKPSSDLEENLWEIHYVSPASYRLVDMHFLDSEHGAILANAITGNADQRLIYSEDGGRSWIENTFRLGDGNFMRRIHLFNDRTMIGITSLWEVMESRDLGKTWNPRGQLILPSARQIVFPYSETQGFVAAMDRIYRTIDGGMTWEESIFDDSEAEVKFIEFSARAEFIQFPAGREIGYAVGGYTGHMVNKGSVLKTTDGGISWARVGGAFADILSASFVSNELGYLFTNDQKLWTTRDGGDKWEVINDRIPVQAWASHFLPAKQGFLANKDSGIWMTDDGGKSWRIVLPSSEISSGGSSNTLFCTAKQTLYLMINGAIVRRKL